MSLVKDSGRKPTVSVRAALLRAADGTTGPEWITISSDPGHNKLCKLVSCSAIESLSLTPTLVLWFDSEPQVNGKRKNTYLASLVPDSVLEFYGDVLVTAVEDAAAAPKDNAADSASSEYADVDIVNLSAAMLATVPDLLIADAKRNEPTRKLVEQE